VRERQGCSLFKVKKEADGEKAMGDKIALQIKNLNLRFGGAIVLADISLDVKDEEILGIIGPNGAGKTCLLNCINGFYHFDSGEIWFEGEEITHMPTHKIARLGIGRVFQGIQLYSGLTTLDNIMAGRHMFMKYNILEAAVYFGKERSQEIMHRRRVEEIIDFLEIESIRKKRVSELPYGMRKRVDLGRALAMEPKLLLLDEPMAGMNLEEKEDMARFIIDIFEDRKTSIVMVEHDMGVVMDICDRVIVFDFGRKVAEGLPEEITNNPRVIAAYLGGGEE
jgi:branched-chain amino acid transport system ATP-binding protein